ncbi:hypothetical protein B4U80_01156, partial [Leptotrombidium deliense]
ILMNYGGIYLDNDVFVLNPLTEFLKFEMTIAWDEGESIGNQILIASKNARFLKLWLKSYKYYDSSRWYYNAGQLPTSSILESNPHLVNRVKERFGVSCCGVINYIFEKNIDLKRWQYNPPEEIYEKDVWLLNTTFGQMARSVLKI